MRDNVAEEVTRLKAQPGNDLSVGGATLAAGLIRLGLVDEFRPIVQPLVLGGGNAILPPQENPINLRLLETRNFRSGVVYLRYQRAER